MTMDRDDRKQLGNGMTEEANFWAVMFLLGVGALFALWIIHGIVTYIGDDTDDPRPTRNTWQTHSDNTPTRNAPRNPNAPAGPITHEVTPGGSECWTDSTGTICANRDGTITFNGDVIGR